MRKTKPKIAPEVIVHHRVNSHRRMPFPVHSLSIAYAVTRKMNRVIFDVLDVITFFAEEVMRSTCSDQHKEVPMTQIMNVRSALFLSPGPGPFADGDVIFLDQLLIYLFNILEARNNPSHVVPIPVVYVSHCKLLYEGIL